jgi:uncharacterized membrane protein YhiD involved in acid resistance
MLATIKNKLSGANGGKGILSDVPGWAKGIILILIILLIVWLIYKFYSTVGFKTAEERAEEQALDKDKDDLYNKGQRPTFQRTQYKQFADVIQQENMSFDTDENKIYNIFSQMKNDLDITLLVEAFGQRRPQFSFNDVGLAAFLNEDLNKSEIAKINAILAGKNIKFRF